MQDQTSWDNCPPGVVTELGMKLRRRRLRTRLRPVAGVVLTLLVLVAVSYAVVGPDGGIESHRLTCREAMSLFTDFRMKKLEPALAAGVEEHLSHCPACRRRYEESHPRKVRKRSPDLAGRIASIASLTR